MIINCVFMSKRRPLTRQWELLSMSHAVVVIASADAERSMVARSRGACRSSRCRTGGPVSPLFLSLLRVPSLRAVTGYLPGPSGLVPMISQILASVRILRALPYFRKGLTHRNGPIDDSKSMLAHDLWVGTLLPSCTSWQEVPSLWSQPKSEAVGA